MKRLLCALLCSGSLASLAPGSEKFTLGDVFELEYASDPQMSPDGKEIVYVGSGYRAGDGIRGREEALRDRGERWGIRIDGGETARLIQ